MFLLVINIRNLIIFIEIKKIFKYWNKIYGIYKYIEFDFQNEYCNMKFSKHIMSNIYYYIRTYNFITIHILTNF